MQSDNITITMSDLSKNFLIETVVYKYQFVFQYERRIIQTMYNQHLSRLNWKLVKITILFCFSPNTYKKILCAIILHWF